LKTATELIEIRESASLYIYTFQTIKNVFLRIISPLTINNILVLFVLVYKLEGWFDYFKHFIYIYIYNIDCMSY